MVQIFYNFMIPLSTSNREQAFLPLVKDSINHFVNVLKCTKSISILSTSLDCLSPLGMEDGRIKDDQLRANSILNGLSQAANGRLNHKDGYGGWCPNQTFSGNKTGPFYSQFIQVKLDMPIRLKGIATQGRDNGVEKVERYWIACTPDKEKERPKWIHDDKTKNVKV